MLKSWRFWAFVLGAAVVLYCVLKVYGCQNRVQLARSGAWSETIDLPAGQRLISASWQDDGIEYLMRGRAANDPPQNSTLILKRQGVAFDGKAEFRER